jgi:alkyl hydroperoxide reductase subunit AhpC
MRPRECFIIDLDGTIQTMEMLTPPVERKLIRTARRIPFEAHTCHQGAQANPASPMPGEFTLKPRPSLKGKVKKTKSP